MDFNNITMSYPLVERIGNSRLLVERAQEFNKYHKWIRGIPKRLSKSLAILARKKSGKTAFVQRLFNQIWSANGAVIPFYMEIPPKKLWYPELAVKYYRTFASQYISFKTRDPKPVRTIMELSEIRAFGAANGIDLLVKDVDGLREEREQGAFDGMWERAYTAPHRFAGLYNQFILVIIDEFQNLAHYIYTDQSKTIHDHTIPGSYHEHSESKIAPMLVTGSAVGGLIKILEEQLEAGRLSKRWWPTYLDEPEALEAVYRYAEAYEEPISNESALAIARLTNRDPYFIACLMRSDCPDRDLTTPTGAKRVADYEAGDENAEMAQDWMRYFAHTLHRVNHLYAKQILLFLTKHAPRKWRPTELRDTMGLDLSADEVLDRLEQLREAEMLLQIDPAYGYTGHRDGTFYLLLQNRLQVEMEELKIPVEGTRYRLNQLITDKKSLQGLLNETVGRLSELQLAYDMRTRKTFAPEVYFAGASDKPISAADIHLRFMVLDPGGDKRELDLVVHDGPRCLLVEVRRRQKPFAAADVAAFAEKLRLYAERHPEHEIEAAVLSHGDFTEEATAMCREHGWATATEINYCNKEWSIQPQ